MKEIILELFKKLPRSWSIIVLAILIFFFLLPSFDVGVAVRFVTFFTMSTSLGWAALRLFWVKRTKDIEEDNRNEMRIIARDLSYAIMVTGCIIGAANISL